MPVFKTVKLGVWERGQFVGAVIFSQGATPNLCKRYGLTGTEVCELVRVALRRDHDSPVSRIVAVALRMLRRLCPRLRLVVSFADSDQGHHGGIYQAGNWLYVGDVVAHRFRVHGELVHPKTMHSRYGYGGQSVAWMRKHLDPEAASVFMGPKHRYLMPLDERMRSQVARLAKPYPKRSAAAVADGHAAPPRAGVQPDPAAPIDHGTTHEAHAASTHAHL